MAAYSVNDKIRLTSARGGWEGFVSDVLGGPGGEPYYDVRSPNWGDPNEGKARVAESDVAAGPLSAPTFNAGDSVTLYGMAGTVAVDNGDGTYGITVEDVINPHLTVTRTHVVPLWRIAIENI